MNIVPFHHLPLPLYPPPLMPSLPFPLFCFALSLHPAPPLHFLLYILSSPSPLSPCQMFVRLFVDENLDRMVPISKQPKEKIQAIIESCSRQFPEFQERARKRIRTYLKSCRRMKKNGMEVPYLLDICRKIALNVRYNIQDERKNNKFSLWFKIEPHKEMTETLIDFQN